MTSQAVDLTEYTFSDPCARGCGREAAYVAKGCMDKEAVQLCQQCLTRGLEVVRNFIRMHQRTHRRVIICGDCHRPILHLDTHLEIKPL